MPSWSEFTMDVFPVCSGLFVEPKTSSSSDEDSELSCLPWDELDAYLHESPPGWTPQCECVDNMLSVCSFCLSGSEGFFSLSTDDDSDRVDFGRADTVQDFNQFIVDKLYPDLKENSKDDLVVLGVGLQALSSAILCDSPPLLRPDCAPPMSGGVLPATQVVDWLQQVPPAQQQQVVAPAAAKPPRTRRGGGGRRSAVPDEEKIFTCPYAGCARVYSKNSHLRAHLRRHTGEKPFVCQWPGCKWRFSRSDELARHKRSHSGVKPYQCGICGKRFGRSDHLAKHERIHRKQGYVIPQKTGRAAVKLQIIKPL